MAGIALGSNITSLLAQRRVNENSSELEKIFERLGSGQRINRASDDAAGLAIASTLSTNTRLYSQALRNVNDGISYLSIAEGALTSLSHIVTRQQELAEQAANGTYTNKQRAALTAEANALSDEFNRITASTSFNGVTIFSSPDAPVSIQASITGLNNIAVEVGGELARSIGTGQFSAVQSIAIGGAIEEVHAADFNKDGVMDIVTSVTGAGGTTRVILGNADGTFRAAVALTGLSATGTYDQLAVDVNNDGNLDIVSGVTGTTQGFYLGNGDGTFRAGTTFQLYASSNVQIIRAGDFNNDGNVDVVYADRGENKVAVVLGNGDGTFRAAVSYGGLSDPAEVQVADLNNDGNLDLVTTQTGTSALGVFFGTGNGTFSTVQSIGTPVLAFTADLADVNFDGNVDIVYGYNQATVMLGNGNGSFKAGANYSLAGSTAVETIKFGDMNGDGILDIVATQQLGDDRVSLLLGNRDGTFKAATVLNPNGDNPIGLDLVDMNRDGVLDILTAVRQGNFIGLFTQNTTASTTTSLLNLSSQASARNALPVLSAALSRISSELGNIGSAQSRLQVAANNLQSARVETQGAVSRIMDADVAAETAALTRRSILQQVSSAILGQANQIPALALQLLK